MQISEHDVLRCIEGLNLDKGPGWDLISNYFVVNAAAALKTPLTIIFNASLSAGIFPSRFKETLVHPIFKSGDTHDVNNYRPIAILNSFAKIFEKLVHSSLLHHVSPYLDENQHGFLPKRSTVSNLLEYSAFLADHLDRKEQVDVIYMDMSKAFDRISHSLLIMKLQAFGVSGPMLLWFKDYLVDRPMKVVFNGACSGVFVPSSGVPQGSILGPLLFVVYLDDLLKTMTTTKFFYADDGKFARVINSANDCYLLQDELHLVNNWCTCNQLPLNPSKCNQLTVTNKTTTAIDYTYTMPDGRQVSKSESVKDLGVFFDSSLRYAHHIDQLALKAFRTLGFVMRTCRHFSSINAVKHLYSTLVLSQLDYCATVWSPYYFTHMETLERVQRRFTRFVFRKFKLAPTDYNTRCRALGLLTLRKRRILQDQMMLHSVVRNRLGVSCLYSNISIRTDRNTRSNDLFLEKTWRLNSTYGASFPRMTRMYNRYFSSADLFHLSKVKFKEAIIDILWDLQL